MRSLLSLNTHVKTVIKTQKYFYHATNKPYNGLPKHVPKISKDILRAWRNQPIARRYSTIHFLLGTRMPCETASPATRDRIISLFSLPLYSGEFEEARKTNLSRAFDRELSEEMHERVRTDSDKRIDLHGVDLFMAQQILYR